jgi:hypothetical protein
MAGRMPGNDHSASGAAGHSSVRSVNYTSSPLLASKTPPWRSRFLVALIGLAFCVLLGRALYVQVIGADFFQRQGEMRFARTLELSASRGRITDRNGLLLASSVPAPSLWAIPKDFEADKSQRRQLAKLLNMTPAELDKRLSDNPNFVWLRRQVDDTVAQEVRALGVRGVHQVREYKRKYPEGESAAHVVGFNNIEDKGQEGIELAFQTNWRVAMAAAVSSKTVWAVWWKTSAKVLRRWMAATSSCPLIPRFSFSLTNACAMQWPNTKPKRAAWWCSTPKVAKCWPWPTTPVLTLQTGAI